MRCKLVRFFIILVFSIFSGNANSLTQSLAKKYASERTYFVEAKCSFNVSPLGELPSEVRVFLREEALKIVKEHERKKNWRQYATATIISRKGHFVSSRHLIGNLINTIGEHEGLIGAFAGQYLDPRSGLLVPFIAQCGEKNIELKFFKEPGDHDFYNEMNVDKRVFPVSSSTDAFLSQVALPRGISETCFGFLQKQLTTEVREQDAFTFGYPELNNESGHGVIQAHLQSGAVIPWPVNDHPDHTQAISVDIHEGMSGGPVFDHNYNLLGLNDSWRALRDEKALKANWFVPLKFIREFMGNAGSHDCDALLEVQLIAAGYPTDFNAGSLNITIKIKNAPEDLTIDNIDVFFKDKKVSNSAGNETSIFLRSEEINCLISANVLSLSDSYLLRLKTTDLDFSGGAASLNIDLGILEKGAIVSFVPEIKVYSNAKPIRFIAESYINNLLPQPSLSVKPFQLVVTNAADTDYRGTAQKLCDPIPF